MLLTLVNCLLGAICGAWFRVQVLIPLIAFACVEETILEHTDSWVVAPWHAAVLLGAIETGYLAGSSGVVLWHMSGHGTKPDDLASYGHDQLWCR